jgi:hypothetical protein
VVLVFMQKPIVPEELARRVRLLLEPRGAVRLSRLPADLFSTDLRPGGRDSLVQQLAAAVRFVTLWARANE